MFQTNRHGCRLLEFTSGGNQFLTIENDQLKLTFWMNKGADLIEIRHKASDTDVLWRNPVPMPTAGHYVPPVHSSLGGFFDYYPGGWQEVFPNAHLPTNEYKNAPLGLHGEVCLLPWAYEVLEQSEQRVSVRMSVRTVRTPFLLEKIIELRKGSLFVTLDEKVTNEGGEPMHYDWGHHPVFGAPFLQEGCVIDLPERTVAVIPDRPSTNRARYKAGEWDTWPLLMTTENEWVDASVMMDEGYGTTDSFYVKTTEGWAALRNPELDLGVGIVWELTTFPYLWIWQSACGNQGYPFYSRNYNLGIEPYSIPAQTLAESVNSGSATAIEAGHSHSTRLSFGLFPGRRKIRRISRDGECTFD